MDNKFKKVPSGAELAQMFGFGQKYQRGQKQIAEEKIVNTVMSRVMTEGKTVNKRVK